MSKLSSSSSSSSASSSSLSSSSCLLPDAGKISVTVVHDSSKSYGLRLRTAAAAAVADTDTDTDTDNNTTIYSSTHSSRSLHSKSEEQHQQRHRNGIADEQRNDDDHGANSNNTSAGDDGGGARGPSVVFEIDMIANHHPNSLLHGSPFQEGDVLQTINNNRNLQDYLLLAGGDDSDHTTTTNYSLKRSLFEEGQTITFVVERRRYKHHLQEEDKSCRDEPQQNQEDNAEEHRQGWYSSDEDSDDDWEEEDTDDDVNNDGLEFCPAIVRAFYRKPPLDIEVLGNNNSVIEFHQVVVNDDDDDDDDDNDNDNDDDDDDDDNNSSSSNSSSSSASICSSNAALDNELESSKTISTKTDNRKVAASSFLQIDRIDSNGMLAYSVLNQGDIVLAINGVSVCADSGCTAEDAQSVLGDAVYDTIDIIALNPKKLVEFKHKQWQKEHRPHQQNHQQQQGEWMKKHIQRASVAIGGGTLIGAGLVIHPFGVALMASGISVLSKEFDAPKRAVRNVRNSLEQWTTVGEKYDDDDASCNSVDFHSDIDDDDIVYSLEGTHSSKNIATPTMKRPIYPSIVTTTGRIQNSNNNSRSNIIADDIDTIIGSCSDSSSFDHRRNDNEPFYHDGNHVLRSSHYDSTTTSMITREDESTISNTSTINNGYSNSNRMKSYVSVRYKSPTDRSTSSSCRLSSPSLLLSQPSSPSSERKTTITNRVKGFGRRFVIPFLDRMSGSDDTKADGRNTAFSKNDCRTISQELRDDTISY